ncbi:MAG: ABC transporter ATP-binding protein [Dehalococcoidia bacterium]|nr:ABC transporter ATP-binding protein [Dehalococcoidia bacterium]
MTTVVKDEKVLEVKNLRTYFYTQEGEVKAVDGLSYYVSRGESVGLVGESACGKSVSALSILRLIPYPPGIIVGGEIIFQGKDILKSTEDEMRDIRGNRIAMIFQEPTTSLNPVLTVRTQISEALELHRGMDKVEALQEVIRLLKLVGIADAERRVNEYPFQFSGGMQQRIMIAMALSCNPALLIADEPTTSVDVTVQAQLLEIIDDLRRRFGTSVIVITHNLGIVARYVDRVNVMYAGRLVETAATEELYANPLHPYTIGLLASVPRLDSERKKSLRIIKGLPPNLARLPSGCAFHPRCDYAMAKCHEEYPPVEKVGENHYRACFAELSKLKRPQ